MALIARSAIAEGEGNVTAVAAAVERLLREQYPKCGWRALPPRRPHPAPRRYIVADPPWLLNNAGGAMGSMLVLHCSLTGAGARGRAAWAHGRAQSTS